MISYATGTCLYGLESHRNRNKNKIFFLEDLSSMYLFTAMKEILALLLQCRLSSDDTICVDEYTIGHLIYFQ